jgi:hypothetical protein
VPAVRGGQQLALQGVEAAAPKLPDAAEPLLELGESGRIERVDTALRLHPRAHQVRPLERGQVLGHRRRADVEALGDVAGAQLTLRENFHNAAAGRVGQGDEAVHPRIDDEVT